MLDFYSREVGRNMVGEGWRGLERVGQCFDLSMRLHAANGGCDNNNNTTTVIFCAGSSLPQQDTRVCTTRLPPPHLHL